MFIQTEATPNPATLKFIPGKPVLPGGTRDYRTPGEADESPLAKKLFEINGVSGVFLGHDFVTVSRSGAEWQQLKPAILGSIMDHYMSGAPVLDDESKPEDLGESFDPAHARYRQDHQRPAGIARASSRGAGWRRHYVQELQGWHCLSQHEGLMCRLSIFHCNAEAWH